MGLCPARSSLRICLQHLRSGLAPHTEGRKHGDIYHEFLSFVGRELYLAGHCLAFVASQMSKVLSQSMVLGRDAGTQQLREPPAGGPGARSPPPPEAKRTLVSG